MKKLLLAGLLSALLIWTTTGTPATHLNNSVASAKAQTVQAKANETPTDISQEPSPQLPTATEPEKPMTNRELGQMMAAERGWTEQQWLCLEKLWTNESNWNHTAHNRASGAHGIPQSLPASKMAAAGGDYMDNPRTQIAWGLSYIQSRYKSPCNALAFWNAQTPHHWY